MVFAKPGRAEATEGPALFLTLWDASVMAGTPESLLYGAVCPDCRAGLESSEQRSAHLYKAGELVESPRNACVSSVTDSGLGSSGILAVSTVRLS